jgi:hypothetical protein
MQRMRKMPCLITHHKGVAVLQSVLRLDYRLGGPRFESWYRQDIFLFSTTYKLALGPTLLPTSWVPAFLPRVKWPGLENDHSAPSNAEVMNVWIHTSSSYMPA